jgi:copper resistance protein B
VNRLILLSLIPAAMAAPAFGQTPDPHAGHAMPAPAAQPAAKPDPHAGHTMPAPTPAADPHAGHAAPTAKPAAPPATDPHAGHTMPAQTSAGPADPHAGHVMAPAATQTGGDLPVGDAPPPPPATDHAADRVFGVSYMDRSRVVLETEHGGARVSKVMLNIAEARLGSDGGYEWDGEAWYGGDLNRLVLKSEGEGAWNHGVEDAEVQVLYSRAVGLYTDLQVGLRHDVEPGPRRTYATVGFESLFPSWFEAEGAVFLSDKGELLGRLEGSYDFRLAQRLVIQPRAELNFSAEDIPSRGIGSGLSDAELGLRLRYEIKREFAPYVGVVWSRKVGDTADFARAHGEDVDDTRVVLGLRAWF